MGLAMGDESFGNVSRIVHRSEVLEKTQSSRHFMFFAIKRDVLLRYFAHA